MTEEELFHLLPEAPCTGAEAIAPFRYTPHPAVIEAAKEIVSKINAIGGNEEADRIALGFSEGKMIGVLIAGDTTGRYGYLAGFSGNAGGKNTIRGFVPPIYDLLNPAGHFRQMESEIVALSNKIRGLEDSIRKDRLHSEISDMAQAMEEEISIAKSAAKSEKEKRDAIRKNTSDAAIIAELDRQSQYSKAELRRLKLKWQEKLSAAKNRLAAKEDEMTVLKLQRADMSDELQKWIFSQYRVHNANGTESTISEIFKCNGSIPPGGTGECAAPKLLEYAYRKGLKPIAMGEFWFGLSPDTAVRTHGHFYPSCTSKCGPLLNFMLNGLPEKCQAHDSICGSPSVIHEDDSIIVVSKPSGMPSVKGIVAKLSMEEWLREIYNATVQEYADCDMRGLPYTVHRLDMDTSGIMLFAKTQEAATLLMRQFEERTVRKTYLARLSSPDPEDTYRQRNTGTPDLRKQMKGTISLPLSPDYDERPRQKADPVYGKDAVTKYKVINISPDGSAEVMFFPETGRTHQLRVHSAHKLGLGRPIKGDMLYGGYSIFAGSSAEKRLCLHALSITFRHPASGEEMTFSTMLNSY